MIPLFWGTPERFVNNYELYEMTPAPEKLPSGGLFAIKNFTLEALYAEHQYCRNIWTVTNNELPLMRYTGCKIKLYRSENTDYIVTFDNSLPMAANLDMYETMHPAIHSLVQNKIIVTKKTPNNKPFKILKIKPPTPLQNKWYFQADMAKTPLCQIRASATSLEEYYVNKKSISSTLTITYIKPGVIENTCFKYNETSGYYCRKIPGTQTKVYLYTTVNNTQITQQTKYKDIVFLGQTQIYAKGRGIIKNGPNGTTTTKVNYTKDHWGNPFHKDYLQKNSIIYYSTTQISTMLSHYTTDEQTITNKYNDYNFTTTNLIEAFRYNPFRDQGSKNIIYLKSVKDISDNWNLPTQEEFIQRSLPLWILTFGFVDYQKKLKKAKDIDTDYMVVLVTNYESPAITKTIPIIDIEFTQGKSPYENTVNPQDQQRWYPCCQYQQTSLNNIAISGPASPRTPPLETIQAKAHYSFYFKWGGNLPPMSSISDPSHQTHYPMPSNILASNSLQNPATRPELLLYNFDERRGQLTSKALKRIQKDWDTKTDFISDADRFQPPIQTTEETTSETSTSEDEEETQTLLLKLQQQRLKQRRLKLRIIRQLGHLPKLK